MNYLFPLAFIMNTFSMTALIVILGLSGQPILAADIGIIHGALTALYFSFSANARSIILNPSSSLSGDTILRSRLILLLPLGIASYYLSALPTEASTPLIIALILRRCVEWLSEIHLSEMELSRNQAFAKKFFYLQAVAFIIAVLWLLGNISIPSLGLFVWSLSPLIMSAGFILERLKKSESIQSLWHLMLPQFGSTMIIGITLYVFRLIILLLTGKEIAGDLFVAFALGGMLGSMYAQVLGPSVILYESRSSRSFFSPRINLSLGLTVFAGVILFFVSQTYTYLPAVTNKSNFFWGSMGASMVGGVIMVYAQQMRYRLLQLYSDKDLFGPDLMINLLIVASVPYLYYIVGRDTLMVLYMISAMLAYVFYWSEEKQDAREAQGTSISSRKIYMGAVAIFILLPVFFQIGTGIFNSPTWLYDSGGALIRLPIPLSVLACYIGIILLGNYKNAYLSMSYIFFSFILMLIAALISTGNNSNAIQAKLLFLIQFILPMAGLVLGQLYGNQQEDTTVMYKGFLYVIGAIVPLHLASSWMNGTFFLYPHVFLFSIYQHLQYVPVIMVSAYLIVLYGLWALPRFRKALLILLPIMGAYVAASISMAALLLFFAGAVSFVMYDYKKHGLNRVLVLFIVMTFLLSAGYLYLGRNSGTLSQKYGFLKSVSINLQKAGFLKKEVEFDMNEFRKAIPNISDRIYYWKFYIDGSMSGSKEFMFGNSRQPDRKKVPSAHNYYLDLLYNFGVLALIPMLVLIGFTINRLYRYRIRVITSPELFCLVFVVMSLILADNSLKVGLRQPYPGIFTYFIWGILLSKLNLINYGHAS